MTIILGIDPGSRITGFGVIHYERSQLRCIDQGCIQTGDGPFAMRLKIIFDALSSVIAQHTPDECAIEEVFMHRNVSAALKLGQARGAAMVAAAHGGMPVAEYAARKIKQAVVGYGAADKSQVQHMIRVLLHLKQVPQSDAADALAVAVCHAHSRQGLEARAYEEGDF